MNRVDELNKILDKLQEVDSKELEKLVPELVNRIMELPTNQFMLLMQVLQRINEEFLEFSKRKVVK